MFDRLKCVQSSINIWSWICWSWNYYRSAEKV